MTNLYLNYSILCYFCQSVLDYLRGGTLKGGGYVDHNKQIELLTKDTNARQDVSFRFSNTDIRYIKQLYSRIVQQEYKLCGLPWRYDILRADEIFDTTWQIMEVAASALIPRAFNKCYSVNFDDYACESVAAHTATMSILLDRALAFKGGPWYNYRELMEAVRRHDLPENVIGDISDNGDRDDAAKSSFENIYWDTYSKLSPKSNRDFERSVNSLLREMNDKSTKPGRMLYLADKASAILTALCHDYHHIEVCMSIYDESASATDKLAMSLCENRVSDMCKASEMWTIGFFQTRGTVRYDTIGFFAAIIIMATLQVHQKWYSWRVPTYPHK